MSDLCQQVRAALATVEDPDLKQDLVSLNMIRDLEVIEGEARFTLVLTTSACPMKQELEDNCRRAAESVPGITAVSLTVTAEQAPPRQQDNPLPNVHHVIAIASGKGGVGKSTVTVNLACALAASGSRVGILDADIHGPSIPMMMGCADQPLVEQKHLIPPQRHGIALMSMGFLIDPEQAVIWRGPMLMGALKQFIEDVAWGDLDYLLIDLPPGTGDVPMSLAQSVPLSGAVVVTTPQAVALLDVQRGLAMFGKLGVPILGLIENMDAFICPQCGHREAIFGHGGGHEMALHAGVPFLGSIPLEPAIRDSGDQGLPIVLQDGDGAASKAFSDAAGAVARQASIVRARAQEDTVE